MIRRAIYKVYLFEIFPLIQIEKIVEEEK